MPVVFSPGEAETRPLDPTAIVYTTAQKVADYLGIGPQEPVLVSADSVSDGVFITGDDYRRCGTEVGDSILIYSDANPLGVEKTITAISNGGASGVKLVFTGSFTHADFQAADNAYVQNNASFTNGTVGRQRGVTRAIVETRIKEIQDRIDNITHNAWRPYLVNAEYINFDTYKPYRRRYYTDYVGTTPLLFRNVQQMLRIELWQGDDYREIGAAEARISIPEDVRAISGSIVMSPGNGSAAVLTAGTSTSQWRADFDASTTAQNLADLINKEDRVSKAAVDFSPAFTLEGSTSNVATHNEFLATANADYGTGVVKVTSMRPVKAGETCSIVVTDSSVTLSQTQVNTATFSSLDSTTINVDSASGFAKAGVCVDASGDVFRYTGTTATSFTGCVIVVGSALSDIGGQITQHLPQVDLQGGSASGDNARLKDWWMDYEQGIIYFNNSYPFFEWNAVKVAYIYGERYLEKAIEEAATKMTVIDLLMSDDRTVLLPEGTSNIDMSSKVQLLQAEVNAILARYTEIVLFE
tara:strand:- start:19745 stop:21322 length:1578 start_codon:yes stop_codon:yes gene_type:complete